MIYMIYGYRVKAESEECLLVGLDEYWARKHADIMGFYGKLEPITGPEIIIRELEAQ